MPPLTRSDVLGQYRDSFAVHGDSPHAVLWPRGRQDLRFDALTRHFGQDGFSVLDFGCGLAHLKAFLDQKFVRYTYRGVDALPEFVAAAAAKYPEAQFQCVSSHQEIQGTVDHVVISGVFNIVVGESAAAYLATVQNVLEHLFSLCRVSLAVNFMTDQVDFMQSHAHHVNVMAMYQFFRERLSPRLILDQSDLPYEFTMVAFKDSTIVRPDNIYPLK